MKITQDSNTGKLLFILEQTDYPSGSIDSIENYLDALSDCISNEIGPDVFQLKMNQERLVSFFSEQAKLIFVQQKAISELMVILMDLRSNSSQLEKINEECSKQFIKFNSKFDGR